MSNETETKSKVLTIDAVAAICHEANRAYCERIGDFTQRPFDLSEEWQQQSAVRGVEFCLANPNAPASANHDSWLKEKEETGWKYGPTKDPEKKEHPCCVPYDQLPPEQQAKDYLFRSVVEGLRPFIAIPSTAEAAGTGF
jgi:hypothetical protein